MRIIGGLLQHTLQHVRPPCPLSGVQTEHHLLRDDAKVTIAEIVFWMCREGGVDHLGYAERRLVARVRGDSELGRNAPWTARSYM